MKSLAVAMLIALPFSHYLRGGSKADRLEITYLGNEGFLVRSGTRALLFDALFGQGLPDYDHVPAAVAHDIETGRSPFTQINALFISHIHPDHLNLKSTVRS